MSRVDWAPLAGRLRVARSIVVATHINADGDGIGCEIALAQFLEGLGLRAVIVNNEPVPQRYRFLLGAERIQVYDRERHSRLLREADLVVVLDNSSVERLALLREDLEATHAVKVCIDHHAMLNPWWDLNCVDTDACASGQLVHELIRHMGGRITPAIAEALYVSFITDTGHFRFSKTTAETHRIVADLLEAGHISPARIFTDVYERNSPCLTRLTGLALTSLRYEFGGRFAWMKLLREEVASCGGEEEDTGDLVNLGLAVDGVLAGALFREMADGRIKVSLRSKGGIDVNALANLFSGGGHRNASGILLSMAMEDAVHAVLARAAEFMPIVTEPGVPESAG